MIYNNTFFGCSGGTAKLNMQNIGGTVTFNEFTNNIFSWSGKRLNWDGRGNGTDDMPSEIDLYTLFADPASCWLNPYAAATSPVSTHYGGNSFKHNIIYKDPSIKAAPNDSLISYIKPVGVGSLIYALSLADLQTDTWSEFYDPIAWHGNIEKDPLFVSYDPDTYGRYSNWWYLTNNSPCIDSGIEVDDTIGAYIESKYPGYGWDNLDYIGSAPDIGSYEYGTSGTADDPICNVSPIIMAFGTYPIGDSTGVDSFMVSNSGEGWLDGTIILSNYIDFSVTENGGDFSVAPGDSRWVTIQFNPHSGGVRTCTISSSEGFCSDISVTGMACSVTPSTINFGDIKVGQCSDVQTLVLQNTGTGTITGTVAGTDSNYAITAGTGAFSLTAGQTRNISVRFCPLTYGIKNFDIHLGAYFGVSDIGFVAGKSTILTNFTTTESASCRIYGWEYDPENLEEIVLETWYNGSTAHGTVHSHTKTGLSQGQPYAVQINVISATGESKWYPSADGYYIVSTADDSGSGGGKIGTYPDIAY
jgi:hypothetical protein